MMADVARAEEIKKAVTVSKAPVPVSERCRRTQMPVITLTRRLLSTAKRPTLSLGQGVVYWGPPAAALQRISDITQQEALLQADPAPSPQTTLESTGALSSTLLNEYVPNEGLPALRDRLRQKIAEKNGLEGYDVFVTPGCNHAFTAVCLALLDEGDKAVLFEPFYFDHEMSLTMLGGSGRAVCEVGRSNPATLKPDLDWLERRLAQPDPPRMVVLVTPNNPTGVVLSYAELSCAAAICAAAGSWLVIDATYEAFLFSDEAIAATAGPGRSFPLPQGPNVIHLFSMSKAYGMMGWRIGYICYPLSSRLGAFPIKAADESLPANSTESPAPGTARTATPRSEPDPIGAQLLKIMDITCICAPAVGQQLALAVLDPAVEGDAYVRRRIESLQVNRAQLQRALEPLRRPRIQRAGAEPEEEASHQTSTNDDQAPTASEHCGLGPVSTASNGTPDGVGGELTTSAVFGGDGAIYFWARLPLQWRDDVAAVKWLIDEHGVCVVPGSAFGAPGHVRVSFANLPPGDRFEEAVARLQRGLEAMVAMPPPTACKTLAKVREELESEGII